MNKRRPSLLSFTADLFLLVVLFTLSCLPLFVVMLIFTLVWEVLRH